MRTAIGILAIGCWLGTSGCSPAAKSSPKNSNAKSSGGQSGSGSSVQGKIEVRVQADAKGAVTDIQLNGKSVGRDPKALRPGVAAEVAAANRAQNVVVAQIHLGAEVRQADLQAVLAALTNDVVQGNNRYRLVSEWDLRVDGSTLVLSGQASRRSAIPVFDDDVEIEETEIDMNDESSLVVTDESSVEPEKPKKRKK